MKLPKACVIGWPIGHSRSPLIHRYWLQRYSIAGSYEKLEIAPERLRDFLTGLPRSDFVGCNVTIPHKEAAFGIVRVSDELTRRLGVVNTIYVRDNTVFGASTDGSGFLESLLHSYPGFSPEGKHFTILGAGGAARAITGTLVMNGAAAIRVFNRTPEKAQNLARDFGPKVISMEWSRRADVIAETDALVNTSALGMAGQLPLEISLTRLPPAAIVADIVYVPLETSLIKAAKERGNRTVPGLGMLLYQAVPGFELWFGRRPEVTRELYDLVAADIEGAG
jgi:shikimate dehydrogenase